MNIMHKYLIMCLITITIFCSLIYFYSHYVFPEYKVVTYHLQNDVDKDADESVKYYLKTT